MKRAFPLTAIAVIAASLKCGTSFACSLQDLEISDAKAEKLGVYHESGKFERTLDPGKVLPARVVACNESLGLILIAKADGSKVWIDPIEVRLPSAKPTQNACLAAKIPNDRSSQALASNGIQQNNRPCSPTQKAAP